MLIVRKHYLSCVGSMRKNGAMPWLSKQIGFKMLALGEWQRAGVQFLN